MMFICAESELTSVCVVYRSLFAKTDSGETTTIHKQIVARRQKYLKCLYRIISTFYLIFFNLIID